MNSAKLRPQLMLALLAIGPLAGLLLLKWPGAVAAVRGVMQSGAFGARPELIPTQGFSPWVRPIIRSTSYLYTIRWALILGILISSAIRAFVDPRILGTGGATRGREHLLAGTAGVPLMLCSCCVAPVAVGAYRRSGRLGPSIALLLSAPSLNPGALALTFLLFPWKVGVARAAMALLIVFAISGLIAAVHAKASWAPDPVSPAGSPRALSSSRDITRAFARALIKTCLETLPFITLGVLAAMAIGQIAPLHVLAESSSRFRSIALISAFAVPMALPTFFEIPLGLGLLAAHVPLGAVAAFLFAGTAINLPSLFTLAKAAGARVALSLGTAVFLVACVGGMALR